MQVASEPILGSTEPTPGPDRQDKEVVALTPGQLFRRELRKDKLAFVGMVFIAIMVLMALAAPLISRYVVHHSPTQIFINQTLDQFGLPKGPTQQFWFGADDAGRDLFVRVLYGARTSLIVAFFATGISLVIGVMVGLISGYYGGRIDTVLSRFTDIIMSLPVLLLALGLVAGCGTQANGCLGGLIKPGLLLVSYVIGLFNWPYISRLVRGEVLRLRRREFVEAARSAGASDLRIMTREVLPNVFAPVLVFTTLIIPNNILFEAALSFLGIGVPATTPSWGKMLFDASSIFTVAWWMMVFPGLFLFATTLSFNLVGDGLRDALDPRTSTRNPRRRWRRRRRLDAIAGSERGQSRRSLLGAVAGRRTTPEREGG
jgi:ABC-type dipeptide/oligopeptide/nickel transport system permease subunit